MNGQDAFDMFWSAAVKAIKYSDTCDNHCENCAFSVQFGVIGINTRMRCLGKYLKEVL